MGPQLTIPVTSDFFGEVRTDVEVMAAADGNNRGDRNKSRKCQRNKNGNDLNF